LTRNKVTLAIVDHDLKVRSLKKYPLSASGGQIEVISGGEGHFMPKITNTSYLELPSVKKYFLFGERTYKRVYFAINKAKKCIDFETGTVDGPSVEEMEKAVAVMLLGKLGREQNVMAWYHWATVIFSFLTFLILISTSGVLR
jgi:hypothetical protein